MNAITLRSGKQIEAPIPPQPEPTKINPKRSKKSETWNHASKPDQQTILKHLEQQSPIPQPFPNKLTQPKSKEDVDRDREILKTFRKVEVNIPLIEAIKQVSKHAKFLKELCMHKRKLRGNEKISMGQYVSTLIK